MSSAAAKKIAVIRMSSIGDIIMTYHAQESLFANGCEPFLVCDKKFKDTIECFPNLKILLCWTKELGFECYERTSDSQAWCDSKMLKENKLQIDGILDLQCTKRSRRVIAALKNCLNSDSTSKSRKKMTVVSVEKKTFHRILLVFMSYIKSFFYRKNQIKTIKKSLKISDHVLVNPSPESHSIVNNHKQAVTKIINIVSLNSQKPKDFEEPSVKNLPNQPLDFHLNENQKYICIFPGASARTKLWPKEHFKSLIQKITKQTAYQIVLCGSDLEKEVGAYLDSPNSDRVINKIGLLTLSETLTTLQNSQGFVSNDSFPGHAAQLFKVPGVVIFGSTSPHFGFQPHSANISSVWLGLSCSPCSRHGSNSCRYFDLACMNSIAPETVFSILSSNLKSKGVLFSGS